MKRVFSVIFSFLILISLSFASSATGKSVIYSQPVEASIEETILIPIKIENNPGIMGFKISVTYDKSVLTSPSVIRGNITQNGMMNDSIGFTDSGTFYVVWSSTQNVNGDDTLMTLSFKAIKDQNTKISLSYSQQDTFNESWENIALECSEIPVIFSSEHNETPSESETHAELDQTTEAESTMHITDSTNNSPTDEEIKNAVDIAVSEIEIESIEDVPDDKKNDFVDRTNEILFTLTSKTDTFASIDELKAAYSDAVTNEFVTDTLAAVNSDKIDAAINDSLISVGAESVENIPDEKKEEFVEAVESRLSQYAPDIDTVSDKLTTSEAVEAIKQLQSKNSETSTQGKKLPELQKKVNTVTTIAIAAIIVVVIAIVVTVLYKKHKKTKEEK